jgi:cyclic pyranopterin monophosphate synthase
MGKLSALFSVDGAGFCNCFWCLSPGIVERLCGCRRVSKRLSHYDLAGRVRMVDVSGKPPTTRQAVAGALVKMNSRTLRAVKQNPKGDPLEIARIAGIAAAKRTAELIPLCHPLPLSHIDVQARLCKNGIEISSTVRSRGPTGVEMEALTAVTVAALTVYDMCKALDRGIEIGEIRLLEKSGGKSGTYRAPRRRRPRAR